MEFRTTPGFSFACVGCGGCCGGQNIGPLSTREVERVRHSDHPELVALRDANGGSLFRRVVQEDGSGARLICRMKAPGCVFLREDGLCTVHSALGVEAKFTPCRMFPFRLIETPDGMDVTFMPECRNLLQARRAGMARSEAERRAEWEELAALEGRRRRFPDPICVTEGRDAPFAEYRAWEAGAMARIAGWKDGSAPALVGQVNRALVSAFGLEPPPPSATRDSLLDTLKMVRAFFLQAVDEFPPPSGPESATHGYVLLLIDSLELAPLHAGRVVQGRFSPEAQELLREAYLSLLFGKGWTAFGPLVLGQAATALAALMAANLAVHNTRLGKRLTVEGLDAQDAISEVYQLARGGFFRSMVKQCAPHVLREFLWEAGTLEERWRALAGLTDGPEMFML
jgi:Fe-S-cluster containining protein